MDGTQLIILKPSEFREIIADAVSEGVKRASRPIPPLLTKAQVADYLGKSVPTIDRYMREGLPFRKVDGGHPEFYKTEIDRWLNERVQEVRREANNA
jgi:excisionase family DNA binding protein